jgi:uncharacterized delta-60 repeat protein
MTTYKRVSSTAVLLCLFFSLTLLVTPRAYADLSTMLGLRSKAFAVEIQSDDRTVIAGMSHPEDDDPNTTDAAVLRMNPDGSPDFGFGDAGVVTLDFGTDAEFALDLKVQSDGKIVVVGSFGGHSVLRLLSNGTLDPDFGTGGIALNSTGTAQGVAIDSVGRIVAAGEDRVARYDPNGDLDPTFGVNGVAAIATSPGNVYLWDLVLSSDDLPVFTGVILGGDPYSTLIVGRLTSVGLLDSSFSSDGIASLAFLSQANALAVQADGKIIAAGHFWGPALFDPSGPLLVRYDSDGNLDAAFGTGGVAKYDFSFSIFADVRLQGDGKIIAAGDCGNIFQVIRFETDGEFDFSFGEDGLTYPDFQGDSYTFAHSAACGLALRADSRIVAVGDSVHGMNGSLAAVLLSTTGQLDTTFEDDGIVVESDCRRIPSGLSACLPATRSSLKLEVTPTNWSGYVNNSLSWKWDGDAIPHSALGSPPLNSRYTVCLYDHTGGVPRLATWLEVYGNPDGWKNLEPNGWSYRSRGVADGVRKLRVTAAESEDGSRVSVRGKSDPLPLPTPVSSTKWFDQNPGIVVRLVTSDGLCLEADFPASSTLVDTLDEFKASFR